MIFSFIRLIAAAIAIAPAAAQEFPSKTIRFVVPFAAGGGNDIVARIVAERLSAKWLAGVVVENKPGGSGNIGAEAVINSTADGYTLLFSTQGPLVVNKSLSTLSFDPDAFVPVSYVGSSANVIAVHPSSPWKTLKDLIAYAKANPDKLNYASQGVGTTAHLGAELLKERAGISLVHVPYRGTGPALADLLGGQVDLLFAEVAAAGPYIHEGKLRALAVGSKDRVASLPDVPSAADDLPGFMVTTWYGVVAPPGTPGPIVATLATAIAEVLSEPQTMRRLDDLSIVTINGSPVQFSSHMRGERAKWHGVIQHAGISGP